MRKFIIISALVLKLIAFVYSFFFMSFTIIPTESLNLSNDYATVTLKGVQFNVNLYSKIKTLLFQSSPKLQKIQISAIDLQPRNNIGNKHDINTVQILLSAIDSIKKYDTCQIDILSIKNVHGNDVLNFQNITSVNHGPYTQLKGQSFENITISIYSDNEEPMQSSSQVQKRNLRINLSHHDKKVELEAKYTKNDLRDILIKSSIIKGSGNYDLNKNLLELDIDLLDLKDSQIDKMLLIKALLSLPQSNITINNFNIAKENYNKVKYTSYLDKELVHVADFSGQNANSEFKFYGVIDQKSIDNTFNGNVFIKNKDLLINGNLLIQFKEFGPFIQSKLHFSKWDITNQENTLLYPIYQYLYTIVNNSKNDQYLDYFIDIRTLPFEGSVDLKFDDLWINTFRLGDVGTVLNIKPGQISLENLKVNIDQENYIAANINLLTNQPKPSFIIQIKEGSLSLFSLITDQILNLKNYISSNVDFKKMSIAIDCQLTSIKGVNQSFDNIKLTAQNDDNVIKISALHSDIFGGTFNGAGSLLIEPYILNFVYSLNSVSLEKFSKVLPQYFRVHDGVASVNGTIFTKGKTIEELLYNLYVKSTLVAKGIKISNLDIDNLVSRINTVDFATHPQEDLTRFLSTGNTVFDKITTDLDLINGILSFRNTKCTTQLTNCTSESRINIYNFAINSALLFAFNADQISKNDPLYLKLNLGGTIFNTNKTLDNKDLISKISKSE